MNASCSCANEEDGCRGGAAAWCSGVRYWREGGSFSSPLVVARRGVAAVMEVAGAVAGENEEVQWC